MAKPEWGVKRICPSCGTRYYDMRKDPPTCPSCGTVFDPEALLRSRRTRSIPVEEVKKKAPIERDDEIVGIVGDDEAEVEDAVVAADDDIDAVEIDDEEEEVDTVDVEEDEDVLLEDADELVEDDDMGEVVDVVSDEDR